MAKSSIHFEKTDASFAKKHNSREEEPTYLLPKEFWQGNIFEEKIPSGELRKLYDEQIIIRRENHARGSTPTFKSSQTEAVINLNKKHTLDDVKRVAAEIEKRYGFKTVSLAIHRDEGHLESRNGKVFPVYNYHAHVVFFTLKDGISMRRKLGSKELEEANTLTAELLEMERGESKTQRWERVADMLGVTVEEIRRRDKSETPNDYVERIAELAKSKGFENFNIYDEVKPKKRLSAKEFRQVAKEKSEIKKEYSEKIAEVLYLNEKQKKKINDLEEEKTVLSKDKEKLNSELLTLKQQKEQIEAERKKYKDEGDHIAEEYRKLQALNKTKHTQEELDEALAELRQQYEERIKSKDKEITELTDNNTVLSNSNKSLEEKLDNYTVLYNNSIHEQNLAQTDLRTFPTLEELTYDRFNLETQYGLEQVYNFETYRGDQRKEQSVQGLSERGMVYKGADTDLPLHTNEIFKLRDGEPNEVQHQLLRSVYAETMIYSVDSRTDRVLSVEDQIRYNTLYQITEEYVKKVKTVADTLGVDFQNRDQYLNDIQKKTLELTKTVLSKPKEIVKTVEVVKEVPRALTISEIEELPRVQQLQQEIQSKDKYYKELLANPDLEKLDKLVLITPDDLTPRLKSTKWGGFKEVLESPSQIAKRINEQLKNGKLRPILENDSLLKASNTVLSFENSNLKAENAELKSWKENCLELLHNFGFYIGEKLPSLEDVKSTVKSFTSRLFSAFMMNNDHDLDYVQNKIVDGQEFKQAQIEKQQQKEQAKQQQKVQVKLQQPKEQERGGMSL